MTLYLYEESYLCVRSWCVWEVDEAGGHVIFGTLKRDVLPFYVGQYCVNRQHRPLNHINM